MGAPELPQLEQEDKAAGDRRDYDHYLDQPVLLQRFDPIFQPLFESAVPGSVPRMRFSPRNEAMAAKI